MDAALHADVVASLRGQIAAAESARASRQARADKHDDREADFQRMADHYLAVRNNRQAQLDGLLGAG